MIRRGLVRKNHCSLLAFSGTVTTINNMGVAFASAQWHIYLFLAVYGLFSGLAEGAERALVIDLVPDDGVDVHSAPTRQRHAFRKHGFRRDL